MKKTIVLWIIFLLITSTSFAGKVAVLTKIMKPTFLDVDSEQLYITEGTTVYIYSLKDYKLVGKFGREGEGPQEFKIFANVVPQKDHLLVNSRGKLSYFTRDGKFLKEKKTGPGIFNGQFCPLEDGFAGTGVVSDNDVLYVTINLYNDSLEKQKEIFRLKSNMSRNRKIKLMTGKIGFQTYNNRIFVSGKQEFKINVMDHTGKILYVIEQKDYERVKLTDKNVSDIKDVLKSQLKDRFEAIKQRFEYPEYYPAILNFFVKEGFVYIMTWKHENGSYEIYLMNTDGKLIRQVKLPLYMQNRITPYSFNFGNGNMYQLNENEDEEWELHISPVK